MINFKPYKSAHQRVAPALLTNRTNRSVINCTFHHSAFHPFVVDKMSSRLQLDMRNLSLRRRHLVNAYEVEAGIGVIAGNTV